MITSLFSFVLLFATPAVPQTKETMQPPVQLSHVKNTFTFQVAAPLARVAPLFGPEAERCWAGKHWDPQFIYPQPAKDVPGAVFTVQHGGHSSLWITTILDLAAGRMQYVAVIRDWVVSVVDVHATAVDASHTVAEVTYTRTALAPEANDDVEAMAANDRDSGPHWQQAIEACLSPGANSSGRP